MYMTLIYTGMKGIWRGDANLAHSKPGSKPCLKICYRT